MRTDMHGFKVDDRVLLEDAAEPIILGTILALNPNAGTAWVLWDNGHDAFDVDIDFLIPENGW